VRPRGKYDEHSQASALANSVLHSEPHAQAADGDGAESAPWDDDDDDDGDVDDLLAGLGDDSPARSSAPALAPAPAPAVASPILEPAVAPSAGPGPLGSFGGAGVSSGPAPLGSFGSAPPPAAAGPGLIGACGSGPPASESVTAPAGPGAIGSFGTASLAAAAGPAPIGSFGSGAPQAQAPPTAKIGGAAAADSRFSAHFEDAGDVDFDASLDDADIPLEATMDSWDVSGGQGFSPVAAQATPVISPLNTRTRPTLTVPAAAASSSSTPRAPPRDSFQAATPTALQEPATPAQPPTPAAPIGGRSPNKNPSWTTPAAPVVKEKTPPSSARLMADLGLDSDDVPSGEDRGELSSDWDT